MCIRVVSKKADGTHKTNICLVFLAVFLPPIAFRRRHVTTFSFVGHLRIIHGLSNDSHKSHFVVGLCFCSKVEWRSDAKENIVIYCHKLLSRLLSGVGATSLGSSRRPDDKRQMVWARRKIKKIFFGESPRWQMIRDPFFRVGCNHEKTGALVGNSIWKWFLNWMQFVWQLNRLMRKQNWLKAKWVCLTRNVRARFWLKIQLNSYECEILNNKTNRGNIDRNW